MLKRLFAGPLLLRIGVLMGGITLLALISMAGSLFIAEASRGDATAINLAGSLRMQAYRIAAVLQSDAGVMRLEQEIRDFERRLTSPDLLAAIPGDPASRRRQAYGRAAGLWRERIEPLLQAPPPADRAQREALMAQMEAFVVELDRMVQALQRRAEANILLLRSLQGSALLLTLVLVFATLRQMHTAVIAPLCDLVAMARQARAGNFAARARFVSDNELGLLGQALNLMAEDLSRMYGELESRVEAQTQALRASNRALELLYNTTRRLNDAPPDDANLRALLQDLETLTGAATASIRLFPFSPHGDVQILSATALATTPGLAAALPPRGDAADRADAGDVLVIPIADQERRFGTLEVHDPSHRLAARGELALLETVARHIAAALRASLQAERGRRLSVLEERNVIARELHDSLAQGLSYLKIQVSRLQVLLAQGAAPSEATAMLGELRAGLNSAYRQLRELLNTFRLKPDQVGLESALHQSVKEFQGRGKLEIALDFALAGRSLSANEEIHVLQIIREALCNVVHHSQARRARVEVDCLEDGRVRVRVADDGIGLPPDPERRRHYGLGIMRERARSLQGTLSLSARPEGGTLVKLTFMPASRRNNQFLEDSA